MAQQGSELPHSMSPWLARTPCYVCMEIVLNSAAERECTRQSSALKRCRDRRKGGGVTSRSPGIPPSQQHTAARRHCPSRRIPRAALRSGGRCCRDPAPLRSPPPPILQQPQEPRQSIGFCRRCSGRASPDNCGPAQAPATYNKQGDVNACCNTHQYVYDQIHRRYCATQH